MATSYISYQANGFWCSDAVLEVWLSFAVRELAAQRSLEPWLQEIQHEWAFYAQAGLSEAIDLTLDRWLVTAARNRCLLGLIQAVKTRLLSLGETLPVSLLNPLMPKGTQWVEAPPADYFITLSERLTKLLEGKLLTDEASPLNYLEAAS
jgi:hypothetical protein